MSSVSSHYSIAVIGMDLAGLAYGAMCAKRGYRVLVVGQGPSGSLYEHGGYTLCRRMDMQFGFGSLAARRVFDELSRGQEMRNLPRPLEPSFQVVLPKARINVSTQPKLLQRELGREFPGMVREIDDFFRRVREVDGQVDEVLKVRPILPPSGFLETLRFRSQVKKYPILDDEWAVEDPLQRFAHGHPLRAFFNAPVRFVSGMVPARPYPAGFVRAISELWKGAVVFERGPDALREMFLSVIANSGDVRPKAQVAQIAVHRGKATHVVMRDRRESIACDLVVCNTDPKRFGALIAQEQQNEEYHHVLHMLQPICHTFIGNFVVRARAIPEAMGRHVFAVADLGQSLEEDNLVHLGRDLDVGLVGEDREVRLITAAMRVPISAASGGPAAARELLDRLQRRVEDVVPFLQEHLLYRHTPWIRDGVDGGAEDLDPAEFQPAYGEAVPHTLGTSPLATLTAYKNILMGGDASFCGLGSDAPFQAAWNLLHHTVEKVPEKSGF